MNVAQIPYWQIALTIFVASAELMFVFIFILGEAHKKSRSLVNLAVEKAREGEFTVAKRLVIQAARFNSNVQKHTGVSAFYDAVVARDSDRSAALGSLLDLSETKWQRSWQERFAMHPVARFVALAMLIVIVLVRVLEFG